MKRKRQQHRQDKNLRKKAYSNSEGVIHANITRFVSLSPNCGENGLDSQRANKIKYKNQTIILACWS